MRIKWIDNAKGIAMLCIIIGHIGGGTYGKIDLHFVYAFHVITFFILSGYTLKIQKITTEYVNKRFSRLMVPYFYTCVAVMVMDVFKYIAKDGRILTITNILAKDIIRSFFASGVITNFVDIEIGTRIGAIWFLPAMFFATLIVQWTLNHYSEEWKQWEVVILVAIMGYISSKYIWLPFSVQAGMTASVFILVGYYTKEYSILDKLKLPHYLFLIFIFVCGVYGKYNYFNIVENAYSDLIIGFFVALSGSFIVFKLAQYTEKIYALNFIGKYSLFFLCVHLVALETLGWYFNHVINFIGITDDIISMWMSLILNIMISVVGTVLILLYQKWRKNGSSMELSVDITSKRDYSVDIMKGILIVSMLVGHSPIDINLRRIIYSCHMVAFVFLLGYFYHPVKKLGTGIIHLYKSFLLPYGLCCLADLLLNLEGINIESLFLKLKSYILAISFSGKLFTEIPSIGVIWFVNVLFLVRLIYMFMDYFIHINWMKIAIIFALSILGFELGNYCYWLPWSLDCALYCLIYYQIGVLCKQFDVISYVIDHSIVYFPLSIIWAYMIYVSSMELAIRQYLPYGLVILGATCGIFLLYMLSRYISINMLPGIRELLKKFGENTLYILIVHKLLSAYIYRWILVFFNDEYIYHMLIYILVQLFIGVMVGKMIKIIKLCL